MADKHNRSPTATGQEADTSRKEIISSILRMSQKALACVLGMVGVGYIGGLFAVFFKPELAESLTMYTKPFIPLFQLEIGVYGFGSTLENLQKIKTQVDAINKQATVPEESGGNG
ncbi:MAG: hypothetical protein E7319_09720 [Clostridiales bacterium]|nr:hypothetical protein [Clostridiales bacterium]